MAETIPPSCNITYVLRFPISVNFEAKLWNSETSERHRSCIIKYTYEAEKRCLCGGTASWMTAQCNSRCTNGQLHTAHSGSASSYRTAIHTKPCPSFVWSNSLQEFGSGTTGWITKHFLCFIDCENVWFSGKKIKTKPLISKSVCC